MRRAGDPRGRGTSAWLTAARERTFGNVTEKLLMMVLCDYVNGDDESWPGNTALAPDLGVDPRTIRRTLDRLESAGVIRRQRRERQAGRGRASDVIVFLWEGFQALPLVRPDPALDDQGDNLSTDQGDNGARPRGHLEQDQGDISGRALPLEPHSKNHHIEPPPQTQVDQVFEAWKASTGRTAATVLDAPRARRITAALKSHPIEDVLDAVRGWEHSPFHRGENPERKKWNDLGLLLRDAENIEKFRDLARGPRLTGNATSHLPPSDRVLVENPDYWEKNTDG